MSNQEQTTGSEQALATASAQSGPDTKKSGPWDWLLPSIAGLVIARVFGLLGGLAAVGVYFWLKPKFGTWGALGVAGIVGLAVGIGLSAMLVRH